MTVITVMSVISLEKPEVLLSLRQERKTRMDIREKEKCSAVMKKIWKKTRKGMDYKESFLTFAPN